ncbi:S2/P23 family protein [Borreliella tanukii]|uniref:S2/P23 family protein n=1 Tax=Borreliella tanukii TaxID=56146 RepID=UPI0026475ED0|nr:S2/P23 family protein [Borreliella tanukii]WKC79574.1 S2/P23 family protein [Borreliella tanukii]WKC82324.1 S2/P23 family protein [Borreliella tanukii]
MSLRKFILTAIILLLTKNIFSKNEINIFEDNNYIVKENVKTKIKKIKQSFLLSSVDIAISQPYMELVDLNGTLIQELVGISYSFINVFSKIGSSAIISFDLSNEASKKYKITKLEFLTPDKGNFINNLSILTSGKQQSEKELSKDAYSFGTLRTESLSKTIAEYYKNNNWHYILAAITVENNINKETKRYEIRINPKIYNDFQKKLRLHFKDNQVKKFPIPIIE